MSLFYKHLIARSSHLRPSILYSPSHLTLICGTFPWLTHLEGPILYNEKTANLVHSRSQLRPEERPFETSSPHPPHQFGFKPSSTLSEHYDRIHPDIVVPHSSPHRVEDACWLVGALARNERESIAGTYKFDQISKNCKPRHHFVQSSPRLPRQIRYVSCGDRALKKKVVRT